LLFFIAGTSIMIMIGMFMMLVMRMVFLNRGMMQASPAQ
jgi:hypothetical protein